MRQSGFGSECLTGSSTTWSFSSQLISCVEMTWLTTGWLNTSTPKWRFLRWRHSFSGISHCFSSWLRGGHRTSFNINQYMILDVQWKCSFWWCLHFILYCLMFDVWCKNNIWSIIWYDTLYMIWYMNHFKLNTAWHWKPYKSRVHKFIFYTV